MFNFFFESVEFDHRFSSSFIALILKVGCSGHLDDFRLIWLLDQVHKLIIRVLVARLRGVIGMLVKDSESSFIRGRNIFEGWMVASEVLDVMKCLGNVMVFKIDIKNAYGCVVWGFCCLFFVRWDLGRNRSSGLKGE